MGICAAVLVCAVVVGVLTRFSFQGSTTLKHLTDNSNINQYTIQIFQEDGVDDLYNMFAKVSNYSALEKCSELIAKVKVTDDRKLYSNTINTKVVLEEIYKSDGNLAKNDNIYIYLLFLTESPTSSQEIYGKTFCLLFLKHMMP